MARLLRLLKLEDFSSCKNVCSRRFGVGPRQAKVVDPKLKFKDS